MDPQKQKQKKNDKHSKQKNKGKGRQAPNPTAEADHFPSVKEAPHFKSMKVATPGPALFQAPVAALKEPSAYVSTELETKPKPFIKNIPARSDPWADAVLTPLGLYYPLGPCKTRLPVRELSRILQALREVFRTQSLHTQYQDSPISATCLSLDQVELEVVLFGARDNPDEMILELSRRDGDSFSYHRYADQIMAAVRPEGMSTDPEESRPVFSTSWNTRMLDQVESLGKSAKGEGVAEALEIAFGMVSTDRFDACRLGLESLVHVTDPTKSGWSTAKAAAECLIRPSGHIQERLSKSIIEYACFDGRPHQEAPIPMFGGVSAEDDFSYLGLIVTSQILQIAAEAKTIHEQDIEAFLATSPDFVGNLLQKVSDVQSNPHRTYYAVKCLSALCNCVPSTKSRIKGAEVEEAQLVGDSCHLALAMVTQKLLVSLQA